MNTHAIALLQAARAKIDRPENWIQGHNAETRSGRAVGYTNPEACRFCASGALHSASVSATTWAMFDQARRALHAEARKYGNGIVEFNDAAERKHEEVLALFDAAIHQLEQLS